MTLQIEQGKGRKDRYVTLSPQLLELLRDWWWAAQPRSYLFLGQNQTRRRATGRHPKPFTLGDLPNWCLYDS